MDRKILILLLPILVFSLVSCSLLGNKTEILEDDISQKESDEELDISIHDGAAIEESEDNFVIKQSLTPMDAYNIYMEKFPKTKVYKIELDRENNKYVYEIEGFDDKKEYELKIDPSSGSIIKEEIKAVNSKRNELAKENIEKIEGFLDKVLTEIGEGAVLSEWTLKMKNNIPELEVEVDRQGRKGIEYTYNIETEELLKVDD